MGFKKTIKAKYTRCFSCLRKFLGYKDKSVTKIDPQGDYKLSNSVVVCHDCQEEIMKGHLTLYELAIPFKILAETLGSKKLAEQVRNKIYNTRQKYKRVDKDTF